MSRYGSDPDDFLAQRDFVGLLRERRPEDRDELTENAIRRRRCLVRRLRHRSERIEQEVRLKLRFEVVESCTAERRVEAFAESLALDERAADQQRFGTATIAR